MKEENIVLLQGLQKRADEAVPMTAQKTTPSGDLPLLKNRVRKIIA